MGRPEPGSVIQHHGIKGMKWGVRRAQSRPAPNRSEDAKAALATKAKIKTEGVHSLSNKELREYLERVDLEKRYKKVRPPTQAEKTNKFISDVLLDVGKQEVKKIVASTISNALRKKMGG